MIRSIKFVVIACVPLLFVSSSLRLTAAELEWPGLLGGWDRDGWVDGFEPPSQWPAQLEKIWEVDVGTGYGSPIVSGDRVYQHARQGDEEVVWCFDINTGKTIWRKSDTTPFTIGTGAAFHGKGPKSCPALADGRLFTMSITGILSAWDAESGDLLWRRDDYGAKFKNPTPYWGASTSPLVDENRVVVHFGGDTEGTLVALDVETGKEIWNHGKAGASYSSPLLVEIEGVRQIVEWNMSVLVGVESATGKQLWEFPFPQVGSDQNMPTPTFHDGVILLGAENRGFRCIEPKLENGKWSASEKWFNKEVALDMSTGVVNEGLLYGHSHYDSGRLFCLDTKTGDILWKGPARIGANATFLSLPGHVIALLDGGELKVIAATGGSMKEAASYEVSDTPCWAPPVLLKDSVLVKDLDKLTRWKLGN